MTPTAMIAISGRIGAGKSTVAAEVAARLNCKSTSFGNFVRQVAASRGVQADRQELQKIGEELVTADPLAFCRAVLSSADWKPNETIVLDGLRHVAVLELLREIAAPQPVILVHLSATEDERAERLLQRRPTDLLSTVEAHSTEQDVIRKLFQLADIRIETTGRSTGEAASEICQAIQSMVVH